MALPDDDRRALAARLATTAPGAVDVVAAEIDDGEDLREVLVDVQGEVVALTGRRAIYVSGESARSFEYGSIDVRRREEGLGIDALVEGDRLVLDVARSTFIRLGTVGGGSPPGRATWLPPRAPVPKPVERTAAAAPTEELAAGANARSEANLPAEPPTEPVAAALPPPGWHPDPSGRHWWRWWDGRGWTEHVADGGAPYVDPLPPR